jgi:hypothetical protein
MRFAAKSGIGSAMGLLVTASAINCGSVTDPVTYDAVVVDGRVGTDAVTLPTCGAAEVAGSFAEDFSQAPLSNKYLALESKCTVIVENSRLELRPTKELQSACLVRAVGVHKIRNRRIAVEVSQVSNSDTNSDVYIGVIADVTGAVGPDGLTIMGQAQGKLFARTWTLGVATDYPSDPANRPTYNATSQRWWQVRESAGQVYFETSPDGLAWNAFASTSVRGYFDASSFVMASNVGDPVPGGPIGEFHADTVLDCAKP